MKFKKIPKEYFITILDRLTRIEPAYKRYKRVFEDIIQKFALDVNAKELNLENKIAIVEEIFNSSLENADYTGNINDLLLKLEEKYFLIDDKNKLDSYQYLSSRINIFEMLKEIPKNAKIPKNVLWLKYFILNQNEVNNRIENNLLYPIEKIILCEGQTEYTLLNTILNLFNVNLDSLGYMVIQAGGKNQVARKYYEMIEYIKLPFFILLDKDALETKDIIEPKLRNFDRLYLINSGEFEDLIPKNLLLKAINFIHQYEQNCSFDDFDDNLSMVDNLQNIYRKYGFGEFKKAHFATELASYISQYGTKEDFTNSEIINIIECLQG